MLRQVKISAVLFAWVHGEYLINLTSYFQRPVIILFQINVNDLITQFLKIPAPEQSFNIVLSSRFLTLQVINIMDTPIDLDDELIADQNIHHENVHVLLCPQQSYIYQS